MTDRPMHRVGITFALRQEEQGLIRVLEQSHLLAQRSEEAAVWQVGNIELMTVVGGIGREACARSAEALISSGAKWVISAGFAGALDPTLQPGDVVLADRVLARYEGTRPIACSPGLISAAPPDGTFSFAIRTGRLVTTDSFVHDSRDKSELARATHALAVDMESYAAGEVCARRGVPFAAVRGVSDTARDDLPEALIRLAGIESRSRQLVAALAQPRLWRTLRRLGRNCHKAADNLGDVLGIMLLRLK